MAHAYKQVDVNEDPAASEPLNSPQDTSVVPGVDEAGNRTDNKVTLRWRLVVLMMVLVMTALVIKNFGSDSRESDPDFSDSSRSKKKDMEKVEKAGPTKATRSPTSLRRAPQPYNSARSTPPPVVSAPDLFGKEDDYESSVSQDTGAGNSEYASNTDYEFDDTADTDYEDNVEQELVEKQKVEMTTTEGDDYSETTPTINLTVAEQKNTFDKKTSTATPATSVDIDWLHIPKTGSSFANSLIFYECDSFLAQRASTTESEVQLVRTMYDSVVDRQSRLSCTKTLQYQHRPIGADAWYKVHKQMDFHRVATMFRSAEKRIASGLVHRFHDCTEVIDKFGLDEVKVCDSLEKNTNSGIVRKAIRSYGRCVKECGVRMITGNSCGHFHYNRHQASNATIKEAIKEMNMFQFVGLTDRWSESMCMFQAMFPRPSGRPYPSNLLNANTRPSKNQACVDKVEAILVEYGLDQGPDQDLYNAAVATFDERLRSQFPQCIRND